MRALWAPEHRVVLERRLWIAVLEAQRTLGLDIEQSVVDDYKAVLHDVNLESIVAREAVTRHDVKARIDEFCELAGHELIHLAMTSRDVTENTEQMLILESLKVIHDDLVAVLACLADLAETHADTLMVARTHNVAAQATTLGKRFADTATETLIGYQRITELTDRYRLRGIKGAVGTQQDQLDLLGSAQAVAELERLVAQHLGVDELLDASGQTYPRSLDLDVVAALLQATSGISSLATTLRLMAGHGLVSEGFRDGQVGSSVMPHKVNARSCERVGALQAVLKGHLTMATSLAGNQWNEGDVSCSAARRVMLPDAFCTADGMLHTALGILQELRINHDALSTEFERYVPLLITTRLLGALTRAGMGREAAHQALAEPSRQAAQHAAGEGSASLGSLINALADDPRVPLDQASLECLAADRQGLAGTAVQQVTRVVATVREVTARHPQAAEQAAEVRL